MAAILVSLGVPSLRAQAADSLPAFRTDSASADPFKKLESGPSMWSANPTAANPVRTTRSDSATSDTVTERLRNRHPAVSLYLGVNFMDFDAKETFQAALEARRARDSLKVLQNFEPVHLAFPIGLQAVLPVSGYLDLVAKTHSYWYKQTAVLGDKTSNHSGEEWFAVQANLAGIGIRYYVPPTFLSVTGGLGLFAQAVLYWNVGNTAIYTPYGEAAADFDPLGSGYEFQFGLQQALTGPWRLSGGIGFVQQEFASASGWSSVLKQAVPSGKAHWGSSSILASLNLWYHFGVRSQAAPSVQSPKSTAVPAPEHNASPPDSTRGN
ncbi:MAG: hypothetical protein ABIW76_08695 [Fibrobacteria bacterium]